MNKNKTMNPYLKTTFRCLIWLGALAALSSLSVLIGMATYGVTMMLVEFVVLVGMLAAFLLTARREDYLWLQLLICALPAFPMTYGLYQWIIHVEFRTKSSGGGFINLDFSDMLTVLLMQYFWIILIAVTLIILAVRWYRTRRDRRLYRYEDKKTEQISEDRRQAEDQAQIGEENG